MVYTTLGFLVIFGQFWVSPRHMTFLGVRGHIWGVRGHFSGKSHHLRYVGTAHISYTDATYDHKNPINKGSRDPLHPPSNQLHYTLFSGVPIKALNRPHSPLALQYKELITTRAHDKHYSPPVIAIGKTTGTCPWKSISIFEAAIINSESTFGKALLWLHTIRTNESYQHTNLHLLVWLQQLSKLNTREAADCWWGISRGVEITPASLKRPSTRTPNYHKSEDEDQLIDEFHRIIKSGYMATWDDLKKVYPDLQDSPIDILGASIVIKIKEEIGEHGELLYKLRIIIDASRPKHNSVNKFCRDSSTALPTVIEMATHMKKDTWAAMGDISDAFHNICIAPNNWANIAVELPTVADSDESTKEKTTLAYHRLAFGIASAVRMFQGVATMIQHILHNDCVQAGIDHLIYFNMVYIDDFLCLSYTKKGAETWLKLWKHRMNILGLPWQPSKAIDATQEWRVLGIMASTTKMELWIDEKRVQDIKDLLQERKAIGSITLKETQQTMGTLNFASTVIRFAKLFSRGFPELIKYFNAHNFSRDHRLQLPKRIKVDMEIWDAIINTFNGKDIRAPSSYPAAPCGEAESDASYWGGGYFCSGQHGRITWVELGFDIFDENQKSKYSTSFVEALALRELLKTWAPHWSSQYVRLVLDNEGLGSMMVGERTKSEQVLPILMDCVALIVAYNIKPKIVMKPSEEMIFSDPLSRWDHPTQGQKYRRLFNRRLRDYNRNHKTWNPAPPRAPSHAQALQLRHTWQALRSA